MSATPESKCDDCVHKDECLTGTIQNNNNNSKSSDIEDAVPPTFHYSPVFQFGAHPKKVSYTQLPFDSAPLEVSTFAGRDMLVVKPETLSHIAYTAICEIQHFFRHEQLQFWRNILDDVEASPNDKFVALSLLKNAVIASQRVLPSCQDTGTAIVFGKKGEQVVSFCDEEEAFSKGIWKAYQTHNYRYSQMAPVDMFKEVNTKNNLPAQVDIMSTQGDEYKLMFVAKGGGSANKSFLYQKTKAVLNPKSLVEFLTEKMSDFGTAACPPYHIAVVIGGQSAEQTLKTVKLASCRFLDDLPRSGDAQTGHAFRDVEWEEEVLKISRGCGIGAQFGGKYFAHQIRVIRLPRHGASCPIGLGVSCSADRQILAKVTRDGVFMEDLCHSPQEYMPPAEIQTTILSSGAVVNIDLNMGMDRLRQTLSDYPIKTRLSLTGSIVVARDIAHAKINEALTTHGAPLPTYFKDYVVYYAGPAKTPKGYASGSFGPTTAGRMDSYVAPFMAAGGSFVTLAKGNRSAVVTEACRRYKGFYLGSIGGPAAILGKEHITNVECLDYPELGMEAVWKIDIVNFPAFIIVDDKGNDFFAQTKSSTAAAAAAEQQAAVSPENVPSSTSS
eukprot:PhM_4_TR14128/c0_g1_i2/m.90837/K01676/E4.2.1.2A, fumA, fumB; fumarate hydratase, class I